MKLHQVIIGVMFLSGVAPGQPTPDPHLGESELQRRILQADTDGDGAISREEAAQAGLFVGEPQRFDSLDADHSGTVTLAEIAQALAVEVDAWMRADTDADGRVTEAEAKRQSPSFVETFRRADVNHDNVVTRTEFEIFSRSNYYRTGDLPAVAPNIIEKRF
jgi:Ca2+-binding EF-hand superfamily protein